MITRYSSADGATILVINEANGTIVDASTDAIVDTISLRGLPALATISNNRQYVAAALQAMLHTELCMYKKVGSRWEMIPVANVNPPPATLRWEEPDDSRHPPKDLIAGTEKGTKTYPLK